MEITDLKAFISGVDFPSSLREIFFFMNTAEEPDNLKEVLGCQNHETQEDQDTKDWESFERYKTLSHFFDKWKKLNNLRTLDLSLQTRFEVNLLMENFVLPLLRAIPQLENLRCFLGSHWDNLFPKTHRTPFDLEAFFSGIEPLQSLKTLQIYADKDFHCVFSGLDIPRKIPCLSGLSSIEIDVKIHSKFDFKRLIKSFLCENVEKKKKIEIPRIFLFCVQDFIALINLMHSVSSFQNLQVRLEVHLVVESIEEIYSNFKYPIYVASNTPLTVNIYLKKFETRKLAPEQREYFEMIFGQLQFTVNEANKYKCGLSSLESCPSQLYKSTIKF